MPPSPQPPYTSVAVALALVVVCASSPAWADSDADDAATTTDRDAVAAVTKLNRRAQEYYENLSFDDAQKAARAALDACAEAGLDKDAVAAQAHLLLGITLLVGGPSQHAAAVAEIKAALAIDATIAVPEQIANPEIQQAFDEARRAPAAASRPRAPATTTAAVTKGKNKSKDDDDDADGGDDDADDDGDGDGDDDDEAQISAGARATRAAGAPSWFSAVGIGGGFGWSGGTGEVNTDVKVPSGLHAASVMHFTPEVGYFAGDGLLLSLQLRVQLVSGATALHDPSMTMCGSDHVCSPATAALALFARATWFKGSGALRPYAAVTAGVGQIRHLASLPGHMDCGPDQAHPVACVDTVVTGPVLVGGGGGLLFNVAERLALTLGVNAVAGIPSFTFNVDLNGGLALEL